MSTDENNITMDEENLRSSALLTGGEKPAKMRSLAWNAVVEKDRGLKVSLWYTAGTITSDTKGTKKL